MSTRDRAVPSTDRQTSTNGTEPTDAQMILDALVDPTAFAILFDRHFVTIHRYFARRIGNDGADDLAGDVFRIAFERRDRFDASWQSALPWLYGIATNLLRTRGRSEQRRLRALERVTVAAQVIDTDDPYERAVDHVDARSQLDGIGPALRRLTDGDRDALILYAVESLSYSEVAIALDIPVGTVRSRINRARRQLREPMTVSGQEHGIPDDAERYGNG